MKMERIKVWDLPTRVFHWLLVVLIVAAVATGKIGGGAIEWHGKIAEPNAFVAIAAGLGCAHAVDRAAVRDRQHPRHRRPTRRLEGAGLLPDLEKYLLGDLF